MGIAEVSLFTAAQQLAQALSAYLGKISPTPKNPWAAAAVVVGQELANNAATAFGFGIAAANAELATIQQQESMVAQQLGTLPAIT